MLRRIATRRHLAAFFLPGLALFAAQAAAQSPGPGREATARRPFVKPGAAKQLERVREFDVTHIKGEFTLDVKKGEIRGTVTHSISPLFPGLKEVTLDCADDLKVSEGRRSAAKNCTVIKQENGEELSRSEVRRSR